MTTNDIFNKNTQLILPRVDSLGPCSRINLCCVHIRTETCLGIRVKSTLSKMDTTPSGPAPTVRIREVSSREFCYSEMTEKLNGRDQQQGVYLIKVSVKRELTVNMFQQNRFPINMFIISLFLLLTVFIQS